LPVSSPPLDLSPGEIEALVNQLDDAVASVIRLSVLLGATSSVLVEHPAFEGPMGGTVLRDSGAGLASATICALVLRRLRADDYPDPDPIMQAAANAIFQIVR
jgi:hypothetical protein